jgi:hypothetical protein
VEWSQGQLGSNKQKRESEKHTHTLTRGHCGMESMTASIPSSPMPLKLINSLSSL